MKELVTISWLDIKICFNLAIYQKKKKKKAKKKTKLVRNKKINDFFDHIVVEYIVG